MIIPAQRTPGERGVWRFNEGAGAQVRDAATPPAASPPMHLTIESPGAVTWVAGGLRLDSRVTIASDPNPHVGRAISMSGEFTLEIWVTPLDTTQGIDPPDAGGLDFASVVQASGSIASNSAMITQIGDRWAGRSRTTATTADASPEIAAVSGSVTTGAVTQLALVTSTSTRTLYVNAAAHSSTPNAAGAAVWDESYKIRIGDAINYDRQWRGTVWYMAIYDRALTPQQIMTNREAGIDCSGC